MAKRRLVIKHVERDTDLKIADEVIFTEFEHPAKIYHALNLHAITNPPLFLRKNCSYMRPPVRPAAISNRKTSSSISSISSSVDSTDVERVMRKHNRDQLADEISRLTLMPYANNADLRGAKDCSFSVNSIEFDDGATKIETGTEASCKVEWIVQQPGYLNEIPQRTSLGALTVDCNNLANCGKTLFDGIPFDEDMFKPSNGFRKTDMTAVVKVTVPRSAFQAAKVLHRSTRSSLPSGESAAKCTNGSDHINGQPTESNGGVASPFLQNGSVTPRKGLNQAGVNTQRRNGERSPLMKKQKVDEEVLPTAAESANSQSDLVYTATVKVFQAGGEFCFPQANSYNLMLRREISGRNVSPTRRHLSRLNSDYSSELDDFVKCRVKFCILPAHKLRTRSAGKSPVKAVVAESAASTSGGGYKADRPKRIAAKMADLKRNPRLQLATDRQAADWLKLLVRQKYPPGFPSVSYKFLRPIEPVAEGRSVPPRRFLMTKPRVRNVCPFCQLSCPLPYSLLKHLRLNHDRFLFTCKKLKCSARSVGESPTKADLMAPSDDETNESADVSTTSSAPCVITVEVNDNHDGSSQVPNSVSHSLNRSPSRANSVAADSQVAQLPPLRNRKVKRPAKGQVWTQELIATRHSKRVGLKFDLKEFVAHKEPKEPAALGHCRVFYSCRSFQPLCPDDLDDVDSDDDVDLDWLLIRTGHLIDEFNDVNDQEKTFMKIWNKYLLVENQTRIYADVFVYHPLLTGFLKCHGGRLIAEGLWRTFLLHAAVLEEQDVITEVQYAEICAAVVQLRRDPACEPNFPSTVVATVANKV